MFDCGPKCICVCHNEIPYEDIEMLAGQTGVSLETAKIYLKKHDGDLAKAVLAILRHGT